MKSVTGEIENQASFITVGLTEMRLLNGEPVIYSEVTTSFNEETIDYMIDNGVWTEDWIDANGGREAFLAIPDTEQVYLYAVVDGNLYIYIGTYYEDADKQTVIDAMTVFIQTTEAK